MKRMLLIGSLLGACATSDDAVTVSQIPVVEGPSVTVIALVPQNGSVDANASLTVNGVDAGSGQVGGEHGCPVLTNPNACGDSPNISWEVGAIVFPASIEIDSGGDHYMLSVPDADVLPIDKHF
jgi:hypothetical protein